MHYDRVAAPDHGDAAFSEHGVQRRLGGRSLRILTGLALAFSAYQLVVAAFHPLSSLVIRSLHVGFLLAITFVLYPAFRHGAKLSRVPAADWLLAIGAFVLGTYHWVFEAELIQRSGEPSTADLFVGTALVILVFEAARRILGLALPVVCGLFLLYGLFGQHLPGALAHRGYGFDQIINQLALGTEGIFGIPTLVSATYIFLFILFGAFLEHAGMIHLFNSLALGTVGHTKGGPAKVSVLSSGLMGTISGSGVANVLTTGQFTIPLMKKFGYSGIFAGAVEATSSMGGQIMPPVMGAVAFIMAENLNVPYAEIVKAAAIPAILYYVTAFWMVHLEAGRKGLLGLPKDQCPSAWRAVKENWHLLLPLAVLVWMLFNGFTPMFAGMAGLALTAILILGAAIAARLSSTAFRYVFWIALGLACAALMRFGVYPMLALILALVAQTFAIKGGRQTLHTMKASLADGARQALPVGVACAVVGVIIGILTLTGNSALADYQAAVQSVVFTNTLDAPSTTPRQITVIADDGTSAANITATVTVALTNDAPVVAQAPTTIAGIAGLTAWYDASDLDGDGIIEGASESGQTAGAISTWADKSGSGHHAISPGGTLAPTLEQNAFGGRHSELAFNNPDFELLARSFGAWGRRVKSADEVAPALAEAFHQPGPALIAVPVDYGENMKLTKRLGNLAVPI